jgi:DNA-binding transcriptional MerR regulator
MKISELSQRSGVPLPTIKFYIREGLLPAGQRTAQNQADYNDEHLARLALIRALKDDAGLAIAAITRALRASDAARAAGGDFVGTAIDAIRRPGGPELSETDPEFQRACADVRAVAAALKWKIDEASSALHEAARALAVARRSFPQASADPYAKAAQDLAAHEIPEGWRPDAAPNVSLHYAVLGTVLAEPLLLALRRMAHISRALQQEEAASGMQTEHAQPAPKTRRRSSRSESSRGARSARKAGTRR